MKLSALALLIPALILGHSSQISAEEYQSFTNASYSINDYSSADTTSFGINTRYFFDTRSALGPLNQFKYINKISNISAGYNHSKLESSSLEMSNFPDYNSKGNTNTISVNGEWFSGDILFGGGYSYIDHEHSSSFDNGSTVESYQFDNNSDAFHLSAGYLFSDDLLVKVNMNKYEGTDEYFTMYVDYNWQLGDVDYVGFTYSTDENLDFHNISAKYFMDLADDSYLILGAVYIYDNSVRYSNEYDRDDSFWSTNASYYFNDKTSISADYNENDIYNLSANHFINKNYAVGAFYSASSKSDFEGFDSYGVSFTAQF